VVTVKAGSQEHPFGGVRANQYNSDHFASPSGGASAVPGYAYVGQGLRVHAVGQAGTITPNRQSLGNNTTYPAYCTPGSTLLPVGSHLQ
jgi:hypothetical protein